MKRNSPILALAPLALACLCLLSPGIARGAASAAAPAENEKPADYVLGPGDKILIRQPDADELSEKPVAIDQNGVVNLPSVGRVTVGGLTVARAEEELTRKLSTLLKNPQPSIVIAEYRSQPVSVLGAVNTPGIVQLQGHKTLAEVLALAGGLRQDAGNTIQITRKLSYGHLPIPGEHVDTSGNFSIASVGIGSMMKARVPEENIVILPEDVLSVPKVELFYVIGAIRKPGGFPLSESKSVSMLQALSLAEGVGPTASPSRARILRPVPGSTQRTEIAVDVRKVLSGEQPDVDLYAQDILFIPDSMTKKIGYRVLESAVQTASGVIVWRR